MDWTKSVFLAHASEDKSTVRQIFKQLRDHGLEPWLDEEMLLPGVEWDKEIKGAIRQSRFFLACFSKHSISKEGYVQRELRMALQNLEEKPPNKIFLIPGLLVEGIELPDITVGTVSLRSYQYVRLYDKKELDKLIATLRGQVGITPQSEASRAEEKLRDMGDMGGTILNKLHQFNSEVQTLYALADKAHKIGDYSNAVQYLETAYKINPQPETATEIAWYYTEGKGVPQDIQRALSLLQEAASKGISRAKTRLGLIYQNGQGVEQDYAVAVKLLVEAADSNDDEAMSYLGLAYLAGQGVEKDNARGIALITKAAEFGNIEAQSTLSLIYEEGAFGTDRNSDIAIKWARMAAVRGDEAAQSYLEDLAKKIGERFKHD